MNATQTLHIVLIEDNKADAYLIEESLSSRGIACDLVHYDDGDVALRHLIPESGPQPPLPDLVLLDLHLPGTEGSDILRALRREQRYQNVPIAIVSGAAAERLRHIDLSGAARLVHKSMDLSEYLRNVGSAVLELTQSPDP